MGESARALGNECGLTAEEMNYLLQEAGFLDGEPGAYYPTEKAEPYVHETDHHRGPGGYSRYNRDWTVRTWDSAIKKELNLSQSHKKEIREAVAERRRRNRFESAFEQEPRSSPFCEDSDADGETFSDTSYDSLIEFGVGAGVVIIGAAVLLYKGGKRALPHVKDFYNNKVSVRVKQVKERIRSKVNVVKSR